MRRAGRHKDPAGCAAGHACRLGNEGEFQGADRVDPVHKHHDRYKQQPLTGVNYYFRLTTIIIADRGPQNSNHDQWPVPGSQPDRVREKMNVSERPSARQDSQPWRKVPERGAGSLAFRKISSIHGSGAGYGIPQCGVNC